jgi:hypothetical protein
VGIDEAAVGRVMPSFKADKPAPKTPATTQMMVEVVHALVKDVKSMEEAAKRLEEQLRKDAEAAQAAADAAKVLAKDGAGAQDGSDGASFMSGMTKSQTTARSFMSYKALSERTDMSSKGKNPDTEDDGTRLLAKNVKFKNVLDHQATMFGVSKEKGGLGLTSLNAMDHNPELHPLWAHGTNVVIGIRNGGEVLLRPIASRAGSDGRAWWTMERIGDAQAGREEWNTLQMVWGMVGYANSSKGNLGSVKEVTRRAVEALARKGFAAQASSGEAISGKTFTPAQSALFDKMNAQAQLGIDSAKDDFNMALDIANFSTGEIELLIRVFGNITEA